MLNQIVLTEEHFAELADREVGPRIRYLREFLNKQYGDYYTSKNVALRIKVISPQALSVIERGETKSCPFNVVAAIAKDFGLDIEVFTDDYYTNGYRNIVISKSDSRKKARYRVGVQLFMVNEQNERRIILNELSDRTINSRFVKLVMSTIINIFTLFNLKKYDHTPYNYANLHYEQRNQLEDDFPWIPDNVWGHHFNQMVDEALEIKEKRS